MALLQNRRPGYPGCALGLEFVGLDFARHFGDVYLTRSKVRTSFRAMKRRCDWGWRAESAVQPWIPPAPNHLVAAAYRGIFTLRNVVLCDRRLLQSRFVSQTLFSTTVSFVPTPHRRDLILSILQQKFYIYISFLFRSTRLWNFTNVPPNMSRELGRVSESYSWLHYFFHLP